MGGLPGSGEREATVCFLLMLLTADLGWVCDVVLLPLELLLVILRIVVLIQLEYVGYRDHSLRKSYGKTALSSDRNVTYFFYDKVIL